MMGADGRYHERLKHFDADQSAEITEHHGIFKNTGDGAVVEFASVVDAAMRGESSAE